MLILTVLPVICDASEESVTITLNMWHSQFSIWLKCLFREVRFAENPTWIRLMVPKLYLKDSQNNRKQPKFIICLAISHNWCSWLITDSARSFHIQILRNVALLHFHSYFSVILIQNYIYHATVKITGTLFLHYEHCCWGTSVLF